MIVTHINDSSLVKWGLSKKGCPLSLVSPFYYQSMEYFTNLDTIFGDVYLYLLGIEIGIEIHFNLLC